MTTPDQTLDDAERPTPECPTMLAAPFPIALLTPLIMACLSTGDEPTKKGAAVARTAVNAAVPAPAQDDPSRARAEVEARIKDLDRVGGKDPTPFQKSIRDLYTERLRLIDDWEKAAKDDTPSEASKVTPDVEAADQRTQLDRLKARLEAIGKTPDSLLPDSFRLPTGQVNEAKLAEMREAIQLAKADLDEKNRQAELLRNAPALRATMLAGLRDERDKSHSRYEALQAERPRRESLIGSAGGEDARRIARESLVNFLWEIAIESQRLRATEARLALGIRRGRSLETELQIKQINASIAKVQLDALLDRFRAVADGQKSVLHTEAAKEESRAATSDDPVEKFIARRTSELLVLEAALLEDRKNLDASPTLSLEEQSSMADRAEKDLAGLRELVRENRNGGLVALRLNNDFRRIGRERSLLTRTDLPRSAAATTFYENALTEVELTYFSESRDDRYERDALLDSLPPSRRAPAEARIDPIEQKHRSTLSERRSVLEELLGRTEATHNQIVRRLRLLDEEYAFIRTSIFWVRDSEPLGVNTPGEVRKDAGRVLTALARLAAAAVDRSRWAPASTEFGLGAAAASALPLLIQRGRRILRSALA